MFENYTDKARRVIFFARYEASTEGIPSIESHHLLIGLMRESRGLLARYLDPSANDEEIRQAIARSTTIREPILTSVDLPLSEECKRILAFSAEEAERLGHSHIGAEHLLLGILREENCFAARLLHQRGLRLDRARTLMVESEKEGPISGFGGGGGRLGSGRGPLPQRPAPPTIRLVQAGNPESLLRCLHISYLPRIGEAIRIRETDGAVRSYRVREIVWEFEQNAGFPLLKDVEVRVVKEDGVPGGKSE